MPPEMQKRADELAEERQKSSVFSRLGSGAAAARPGRPGVPKGGVKRLSGAEGGVHGGGVSDAESAEEAAARAAWAASRPKGGVKRLSGTEGAIGQAKRQATDAP